MSDSKHWPKDFHRVIGIDPDVDKNGVAFIEGEIDAISVMDFWQLYEFLKDYKKSQLVYLEAGWLNRGNWHLHQRMTLSVAAEVGRRTGLNHATGQMIESMCIYLKIPYKLIRPTKTKLHAKVFFKLTGHKVRVSDQEMIDAMMLIHGLTTKK